MTEPFILHLVSLIQTWQRVKAAAGGVGPWENLPRLNWYISASCLKENLRVISEHLSEVQALI